MKTTAPAVGYMAHLDGIRAVAVGGVIFDHWSSALPRPIPDIANLLDLSRLGVECFFVLSGFLITLILLQSKMASVPIGTALGHFYVRRILRIFPVYYLTLAIAFCLMESIRGVIAWHALYITNIYTSWFGIWPVGGHFWSLAVEEQFYLLWPLTVLILPIRKVRIVAVALCVAAPLFRLAVLLLSSGLNKAIYTSTISALDLLCFGSLLACTWYEGPKIASVGEKRLTKAVGILAFVVYVGLLLGARESMPFAVFGRTLVAVFCGALILTSASGLSGPGRLILGNPVVVWLGTISYGLYIFHPFVPSAYLGIGNLFGTDLGLLPYYIRLPLWTAMLVGVTAMSYYCLEQPIRRLKRYFA